MACNSARPLLATSESYSQDSQDKLLFLIREHGIGVIALPPAPSNERQRRPSVKASIQAPSSYPGTGSASAQQWPRDQHFEDASSPPLNDVEIDANTNAIIHGTDAHVDTDAVSCATSSASYKTPRFSTTKSPPTWAVQKPAPSLPCDVPALYTKEDATLPPPQSTAPLRKQPRAMSSQSSTQENEGRSYEQYARDDASQPSSPPGSFVHDHRTLQEGDTGYVDFKYPFDLPDTAPNEPETSFRRDDEHDELHDPSQSTPQTVTARPNGFEPETPAAFPRPFISGGNGHVMPASQLFGQTQPTSGLKKASPTSSRPSPNIFAKNVTSPTNPASSPLKNRGFGTPSLPLFEPTSPTFPERSSQPPDSRVSQSSSPVRVLPTRDDLDEDRVDKTPLPKLNSRRGRIGLEPIDEYRPYQKRALNSDATRSSSQHSFDSDFEREEAELRRQRARLKKERASKSFPEISLPLPSSGKTRIEVPSTNRTKRSGDLRRTASEGVISQRRGKYATDNDGSQETVVDSQDLVVQQNSINETNSQASPARDDNQSTDKSHAGLARVPIENTEKDMIPETSPACTFAEPPKLMSDIMRQNSSASSGILPLSYPTPSPCILVQTPGSQNKPSPVAQDTTAAHAIDTTEPDSIDVISSPSVVPASQQSARRQSARLRKPGTPSRIAPGTLSSPNPGTRSSTLSVLSTTPVISSSLAPETEGDHNCGPQETIASASSPSVGRGRRLRRPPSSMPDPSPSSTRLKTYSSSRRGFSKGTRQSSRHSSLSLDELDKSPAVSTSEDSRAIGRKASRKSTTLREFRTKSGIFEGMVFAISFQERRQPQKCRDKLPSKSGLEAMIREEGGTILDDGFNSLFEFDTLPTSTKTSSLGILSSSLKLRDSGIGFAALIADGHSRKVKYMQALALGIPCLAPRWVTACISKNDIVDWSSYLLCAGSSTLLGDAIRSRNLLPYDASTAKLAQIISQRPKLLDESKILLIMKKTKDEEKRLPYVFLAQVLGASLTRVHSVEEARAKLREAEGGNDAFDWVFVDDHLQDARTALFGAGPGEGASKKRKRTNGDPGDLPPKRVRTLNNELVIQSLILGRLVEEDELED
ncbi:hypothetical protein F5Y14DRAFT_451741 [Nemania sp. NC0429]|nr:hypothetical protein F5Y14DRAFT_451741 [Nemania sp. NC0429]